MKKSLMISLGVLLLMSTSTMVVNTVVAAPTETNQVTTVKVGLIAPVTGQLQAYASGFENSVKLAIADINLDASINSTFLFELTGTYDTQTSGTGGLAAMTAATDAGVDYVVGAAGSSVTLAAGGKATETETPLISYASTSPELSTFNDHGDSGNVTYDNGYVWRIPPSDANQGKVIAQLAAAAGYSEMVIITLDNAYGSGLAAAANATFIDDFGGEVLAIYTYAEALVDFSTIVTNVKADEPDIVVAISYGTDGSLLFVEMDTQGLDAQVIGADGVASTDIFTETTGTQEAMQGFVVTKPSGRASNISRDFDAAYDLAYPAPSGSIYRGESYDAVWAGALAINATRTDALPGGSTDGPDIIKALADVEFDGVSGHIAFDDAGDRICEDDTCVYQIQEVQGAEMVNVATWDPVNAIDYSDTTFLLDWKNRNDQGFVSGTDTTPVVSEDDKDEDSPVPVLPVAFALLFMTIATFQRKRRN